MLKRPVASGEKAKKKKRVQSLGICKWNLPGTNKNKIEYLY